MTIKTKYLNTEIGYRNLCDVFSLYTCKRVFFLRNAVYDDGFLLAIPGSKTLTVDSCELDNFNCVRKTVLAHDVTNSTWSTTTTLLYSVAQDNLYYIFIRLILHKKWYWLYKTMCVCTGTILKGMLLSEPYKPATWFVVSHYQQLPLFLYLLFSISARHYLLSVLSIPRICLFPYTRVPQ